MVESSLNVWMNVAVAMSLVGFVVYVSCLGSTTWWED